MALSAGAWQRGAICELHRYPVAVAILRANFGHQLERLDARNGCEVLRGLKEVTLFRRPFLMDECERNGVSAAAGGHSLPLLRALRFRRASDPGAAADTF